MSNIIESATLNDIALYLQREESLDSDSAQAAAQQVLTNFIEMRNKGLIKGWYFDDLGHLELLPTDSIQSWIDQTK
ncbi:hypothetical protein C0Z01_06495 [Photobacterium kishitanii]|uniref:Uncharacterized protein n=1 Tax=Photobacterium kishitanii TaxID=318456 RepID=A0A2T3KH42_9GAMM|nr:hypothetical protein [Photobacterium kishitanii]KJG10356.1 hypothetical protein UB40_07290 [Photobacterium kishitanii]KJG56083.1 hypothetical protein UA38_16565 [Photobacterium kishitanii]KJG61005.1 hypothetical protein UA42_12705 [Photobacterium kishitanii]KJG65749.1 hypothetical protein UA40_10480 [Photobacterium kishitanii]KJG68330.1 hypothetical protein UA41_17840 [Photobacterium kishitanii]